MSDMDPPKPETDLTEAHESNDSFSTTNDAQKTAESAEIAHTSVQDRSLDNGPIIASNHYNFLPLQDIPVKNGSKDDFNNTQKTDAPTAELRKQVDFGVTEFIPLLHTGSTNNPTSLTSVSLPEGLKETTDTVKTNGSPIQDNPETAKKKPSGNSDVDSGAMADDEQIDASPIMAEKKKKKKKKSKSQRGIKAPTGFEEYYVDPPTTPAEATEEQKLYDKANPFAFRIETAIQRYRARRNFDSSRKDFFDKYMTYGGVDSNPRMFTGGIDQAELKQLDAKEIATRTAINYVCTDKYEAGQKGCPWVVDFEHCVKGFLSSYVPQYYGLDTEKDVKYYTNIIFNFLNYLLHHDVCPEYNNQIYAARDICTLATKELWSSRQADRWLPGSFNMSCSTLFHGVYRRMRSVGMEWAEEEKKEDGTFEGIQDELAKKIVKMGLAWCGTNDQCKKFAELDEEGQNWPEKAERCGIEVTNIIPPTEDAKKFYHENAPELQALGRLQVRYWRNPRAAPEDLTLEEEAEEESRAKYNAANPPPPSHYDLELFLESDVLEHCFVGMKIDAEIRTLNCGISYLEEAYSTHISFFMFTANEKIAGWKDPVFYDEAEKPKNWVMPELDYGDANVEGAMKDIGIGIENEIPSTRKVAED
ncbi:MAG: hypothetical protein M1834_004214 [Cirrosporium novae-zelandiae]|nr:MAG: hypothetical protein M1834_004214 [Cirrosporium novae-zelandiae]